MLTMEIVKKYKDDSSVLMDVMIKNEGDDVGLVTYRMRLSENKIEITIVELIVIDDTFLDETRYIAIDRILSMRASCAVELNCILFENAVGLFAKLESRYPVDVVYKNNVYYVSIKLDVPSVPTCDAPVGRGETAPVLLMEMSMEEMILEEAI